MTPRTITAPPDDKAMWRKLLARVHPDAGGEHELFVWVRGLQEHVDPGRVEEQLYVPPPPPPPRHDPSRITLPADYSFEDATSRALLLAHEEQYSTYRDVLLLLEDCHTADDGPLLLQQNRGASYKQLAAVAHKADMSKSERVEWYRLAESIPLSTRHVGHMFARV